MSRGNLPRRLAVDISAANIHEGRQRVFVNAVNEQLDGRLLAVDDPSVVERLLWRYFEIIGTEDDERTRFLHQLGRYTARFVQNKQQPAGDRVPDPSTASDIITSVAHTIAHSINARRRALAQELRDDGASSD